MSFCAGPRMKRLLGSEVSREEALKLIPGICVLTEVLKSCCKIECKGEEKNDGNCFSLLFIMTWLWLKSQESPSSPHYPRASCGGGGRWDNTAWPHLWPMMTKRCFWRTCPSPSQKKPSICFLHSLGHLLGVTPELLINEDPSFPCYLHRGLHTAPFKPEGLGYNSFYDKKEYLFILALAAARKYFKHICSEWPHCMAQSSWYVKFPEQWAINTEHTANRRAQAEDGVLLPHQKMNAYARL